MTLASKNKGISSGGDVIQPHKLNGQSRDTAKGTLSTSHLQNKDQKEKRNPEKTNKMSNTDKRTTTEDEPRCSRWVK